MPPEGDAPTFKRRDDPVNPADFPISRTNEQGMTEMQTIVKLNVRTEHDGGRVTWVDIDTSDAEGRDWLLARARR